MVIVSSSSGDSGSNELTFLSHAHSRDMISESAQAGNEKGRLIFLFPADRLYVASPESDELALLHRWVQLISHTDSVRVRGNDTALHVQYDPAQIVVPLCCPSGSCIATSASIKRKMLFNTVSTPGCEICLHGVGKNPKVFCECLTFCLLSPSGQPSNQDK